MTNYTAQAHQLTNWLENVPTGLSSLRVKRKKKNKAELKQQQQ